MLATRNARKCNTMGVDAFDEPNSLTTKQLVLCSSIVSCDCGSDLEQKGRGCVLEAHARKNSAAPRGCQASGEIDSLTSTAR